MRGQSSRGYDDRQFHTCGTEFPDQLIASQIGRVVLRQQQVVAAALKHFPSRRAIFNDVHPAAGTNQCIGVE
jgi:hypothetical protein